MSERSYGVRLTARVSDYRRKMGDAARSTKQVGDEAERTARRTGEKMSALGGKLTTRLTLPIAAGGVAATKMSVDFDAALTKITSLVGVSADEVAGMREEVLKLAGETARSPQELADALFFITSAGLEGRDAMEALEMSARASAVGLGDTATVADLVTSAMNAYGPETLNAAAATDALTEAVRLGKLEPDQLAGAMGRVLPLASGLGVEFHEVSAAMAAMSRTGTNANEAATQLRGIMTSILSPTTQAREALAGIGLSVEGVQDSLANDGLLATLQMLKDRLGGNAAATEAVFGNVRALSGVMDMLGASADTTAAIFEDMTETTGATNEAFEVTAESGAFKMQQAWAQIQTTLIQLGDIIAPLATTVASWIGSIASAFGSLPEPLQKLTVGLLAAAAAAGPLLSIGGKLVTNSKNMASALGKIPGPLLGIGAAAAVSFIAYNHFTASSRKVAERTREVGSALAGASDQLTEYAQEAAATTDRVDDLAVASRALNDALLTGDGGEKITQSLGTIGLQADDAARVLLNLQSDGTAALRELGAAAGFTGEELDALVSLVTNSDDNFDVLTAAVQIGGTEMAAAAGAMEELQDQAENIELADVARQFLTAEVASDELRAGLVAQAEELVGASRNGERAYEVYERYTQLLVENADALTGSTDAAADAAAGSDAAADAAAALAEELGIVEGAADDAAEELRAVDTSTLDAADAFETLIAQAGYLNTAFDKVLGRSVNLEKASLDLADGYADLSARIQKATEDGDAGATSLDGMTEAGRKNRREVLTLTEDITNFGVALVEQGHSAEDAAAEVLNHRDALIAQLTQLGFNQADVEKFLETLGFTPEQITTALEVANVDAAKARVQEQLDKLGDLPDSVATEVETLIAEGEYAAAERRLNHLARGRTAHVRVRADGTVNIGGTGGVTVRGDGGYRNTPELALWAEDGAEAILPLTKSGKLDALMADRRIYEPVLASLARVGAGMSSAGSQGRAAAVGELHLHNHRDPWGPKDLSDAIEYAELHR